MTLFLGAAYTLVQATWLERQTRFELFSATRGEHRYHGRAQALTIGAQVAVSGLLFLAAATLTKSLATIMSEPTGFATEHVVMFGIGLPDKRYPEGEETILFHRRFSEALDEISGVESVSFSGLSAPLGRVSRQAFELEEFPLPPIERHRAVVSVVTPEYFHTLGIPLMDGRTVRWTDEPRTKRVVLVSESFVRRYLAGRWQGRRLRLGWFDALTPTGSLWEIVGVVGDVRAAGLELPPEPTIYLSASQVPANGGQYFLATGRSDADLFAAIRSTKERIGPRDSKTDAISNERKDPAEPK